MRSAGSRIAAVLGTLAMGLGLGVASSPVASAVPAGSVSWPNADFNGYASGSELHLNALTVPGTSGAGSTTVADLDQGFSGASTASAGLTQAITSETTSVIQPAQAAGTKAYGTGAGLEIGVGTSTLSQTDQNQIKLKGRAEQVAPPNSPAATADISIPASPLINASILRGEGAAVFDSQVCPLGQPISYGMGNAAAAQAVQTPTPVVDTTGTGTSVAQSASETYLSPNGDGTFGLSTSASDVIAPLTINIPGGLQLSVTVQSAGGVNDPVRLTAKTTGEATGAALTFSSDDILKVDLVTPAGSTNVITVPLSSVGQGGLHIPLSTSNSALLTQLTGAASGLTSTLPAPIGSTVSGVLTQPALSGLLSTIGATVSQVTQQVAVISLGSIDVDTYPHVIGQAATVPATPTGGKSAAGSLDLLHLNLGISGSIGGTAVPSIPVADFYAGHLQTAANLAAPIVCSLPVIKSADPTAVTAGQSFKYDIQVPDPAKLDLIDCNLDNITVTDTVTDVQGASLPAFTVTSPQNGQTGVTVKQVSDKEAVVTWTGLSYKVAPTGQPPTPPIPLSISIAVPASSPSGTIQDTVVATATTSGCQGGVAGSADVSAGAGNGAALTGSYSLQQPAVAALTVAPVASPAAPKDLPFTGAMGGLWQPIGGLGALAAGGGALALVRRSRRLPRQ